MNYNDVCEGVFLRRPNRFIAEVEIDGIIENCHVKNTGRCKELLLPGAKVYLNKSHNPNRTTKYDLTGVWKGERLVNIDSSAPNCAFRHYLQTGKYINDIILIKSEAGYGKSRFDFYVEAADKILIEVKGVTLEKDGIALFPDAPTERGIKHLKALAESVDRGYEAHIVFVIQMRGVHHFEPNYNTHPEFGAALIAAQRAGVKIRAFDCEVTPDSLIIGDSVEVYC